MALNTPYKRVNITTGMPNQSQVANDPWGSLGTIIGTVLGNAAYERGVKKGTEDILSGMAPKSSEPAPQDIIDQAMTLSVGGNTVGAKDVEKAGDGEGKGTIKPELDHGMLKYGYLMDKYKDSPNPVSDAITTKNIVQNAEIGLSNANMDFVPEADFKLQVMKKLMADGRNSAQREAIWENIKPVYDARKKEYNQEKTNELVEAYKIARENNDYAGMEQITLNLHKYNPEVAGYFAKNNVGAKDMFNAEKAERIALAKAKGKGSKTTNASGLQEYRVKKVSDKQYQMWRETLNDEEAPKSSRDAAERNIKYYEQFGTEGIDINDGYSVTDLVGGWLAEYEKGNISKAQLDEMLYDFELRRSAHWGDIQRWVDKIDGGIKKREEAKATEKAKRERINKSALEVNNQAKAETTEPVVYTSQGHDVNTFVGALETILADKEVDKYDRTGFAKHLMK